MRFILLVFVMLTVSACADRSYTPTVPAALSIGTSYTVFAGTTRAREPDGSFSYRRAADMRMLELTVSIPPTHRPGGSEFAYAQPDPNTEFTLAGQSEFSSDQAFQARLRQSLNALPPNRREVTVFVHGYNATQSETAFRAAQIAHDLQVPGVVVIYSWPSQGRASGYAYDHDSMLFARDGLERLLKSIRKVGPRNIVLVGHSMGGALSMETMRQADIGEPGWSARTLGGVVLVSPDLDVQVFRRQMSRLTEVPQPFVVAVSQKDKILDLSGLLRADRNRERLGNIRNIDKVSDLPITIIDTTAFSDAAESPHFVAATSPALIALFNHASRVASTFGTEQLLADSLVPATVVRSRKATEIRLLPTATRDPAG